MNEYTGLISKIPGIAVDYFLKNSFKEQNVKNFFLTHYHTGKTKHFKKITVY